jgi:hypothetical protein
LLHGLQMKRAGTNVPIQPLQFRVSRQRTRTRTGTGDFHRAAFPPAENPKIDLLVCLVQAPL